MLNLFQHPVSVIAGLPHNLALFVMLNLIQHPVSVIPDLIRDQFSTTSSGFIPEP